MNVIDTLVTVFKLDSTQFQKDVEKSDSAVDKAEKGMTDAEKATKKLEHSFISLAGKVAASAGAFLAVSNMMHGFSEAANSAIELKKLSDATDMSMEKISAWGRGTIEFGGTQKDFQASLSNLNQGIRDLAITGDSALAPMMRGLGLNFLDAGRKAKPLDQVLLDLSDRFEKMDKTKAIDIGKRMGLDQSTVFMLMKGRIATNELLEKKKELGALDAKNAAVAIKYNVVMDETKTRMEHLYMAIGTAVLPVINAFLKGFGAVIDFFTEHQPLLYAMLAGLAVILWSVAAAAWGVVAPLLIAAAPIIALAVAAGVLTAALGFLVDDLWEFAHGNDSVLGAVIQKWEDFKGWLMEIWNSISSAIGDFWESLLPPEWLMNIIGGLGDAFNKAASFVMNADAAPTNSQTTNSIVGGASNSTTNNIRATATINTQSTDPGTINKLVGSTFGDQLRAAIGQADDGVRA